MTQFSWYINLTKCTGCRSCILACKHENNTPLDVNYRWVVVRDTGTFPSVRREFVTMSCNHCDHPACLESCPVDAITKRAADGLVTIDQDLCIGCQNCLHVCPYGAPQFNHDTQKVEKCTGCAHLLADGKVPACAANCVGRAIVYSDAPPSGVGDAPSGFASPQYTGPNIHFDV